MPARVPADREFARRVVLAGGIGGLVGTALAACTGASRGQPSAQPGAGIAPPAVPSADEGAVRRARTAAAGLAVAADRLAAADPGHARLLREVAADHRAHLAALDAAAPGAPSPTPSGLAHAGRLADAGGAEEDAARGALDDVQQTSPMVAALLARIAAARAAHADLLAAAAGARAPGPLGTVGLLTSESSPTPDGAASGPAGPAGRAPLAAVQPSVPDGPVPVPGTLELAAAARDALAALTAGEHAAVFAYGLIAARVSQDRRAQARAAWAWHVARRDLLEERLLAAGVQPPVAAPAYDLGGTPNAAGASRLAATVERRLGALAVRAVAATEGNDRREAAAGLVEGARRLAAWTGRPETLPG